MSLILNFTHPALILVCCVSTKACFLLYVIIVIFKYSQLKNGNKFSKCTSMVDSKNYKGFIISLMKQ